MTAATKLLSASGGVPGGAEIFSVGTYNWTAPAGVTSVSVTGQGANGSGASQATFNVYSIFPSYTLTYSDPQCFGTDVGSSYTSDRSSRLSTANSQLASFSSSSFTNLALAAGYYMYCTTTGTYKRYISTYNRAFKKVGSTVYVRTSSGSTGSSTTALGKTFSGGTSTSTTAPTTTYNNVSVTPGTTYSVTNRQYLRIFWG